MLIDSHCHLDFPDFAEERAAIVARAKAADIGRMVTISTRVKRFQQILEIAGRVSNGSSKYLRSLKLSTTSIARSARIRKMRRKSLM